MRAKGIKTFGCEKHRFLLSRPLSPAALARFEERFAVSVPEDYRSFLLEAGDGGAGPYYGLYPLESWNRAVDAGHVPPNYLSKPCPLHPEMLTGDDWLERLGCSFDESLQGAISIAHMGCTYLVYLVFSGQARGRVFYMDEDGGPPYFVWNTDFLSWYERWLDELLWGYDDSWFGFGLPGREEELIEAVRHRIDSTQAQREALRTFHRIPELSDNALQAVRGLLDSDSAELRAAAVSLLGERAAHKFRADIAKRLQDLDASVRTAAISAHAKLDHATLEAAARDATRDSSPEVVFAALRVLKGAGLLRQYHVEPLLRSANAQIRSHAVWAAGELPGPEGEIPVELLEDPDPYVRRCAIFSIRDAGRRQAVPALLKLLRRESDVELIGCLVKTLGHLADRQAVPLLIEMTRHADAFVRLEAARALGEIRDRRAIPALKALLSDHVKPVRRDPSGFAVMTNVCSVADVARSSLREFSVWSRGLRYLFSPALADALMANVASSPRRDGSRRQP